SAWSGKRGGVAVASAASGNYIAGAVWPPIVELMIHEFGWRTAYASAAGLCVAVMVPLAFTLRRRAPDHAPGTAIAVTQRSLAAPALSPNGLQGLLMAAGLGSCIDMSLPPVYLSPHCSRR